MKLLGALVVAPLIDGSLRTVLDTETRFSLILNEDDELVIPVGLRTVSSPRYFRLATGSADIEIMSPSPAEFLTSFSLVSAQLSSPNDMLITETSGRNFLHSYGPVSGSIGAMYGSLFANQVGSIMLIPRVPMVPELRSFTMIVRPVDPARYCLDYQMVFINASLERCNGIERCMTIQMGVSLEPSNNNTQLFDVPNDYPMSTQRYQILTESEYDSIPSEIFSVIQTAIRSATGISESGDIINMLDCESFIDDLPSIRYTFMENSETSVYVVLSPRDYIEISPEEFCKLRLRRSNQFVPNRLGVNFLERVAVYIDYETPIFGFCEPL